MVGTATHGDWLRQGQRKWREHKQGADASSLMGGPKLLPTPFAGSLDSAPSPGVSAAPLVLLPGCCPRPGPSDLAGQLPGLHPRWPSLPCSVAVRPPCLAAEVAEGGIQNISP